MAIRDITIDVDFAKKDILTKFNVKQFDNANLTINTLMNGSQYNPIGNNCKFYVGIDDDLFLQEEDIQVQENKIVIKLNGNIISRSGMAYAELELKNSEGVMTSITFIFYVDKKIGEGATLPVNIDGFVAKYEKLIREFKNDVDSTVKNCNDRVDNKLDQLQSDYNVTKNEVVKKTDDKIVDIENRFNELTAKQQQDSEVIDARDNEVSLKARLDRDLRIGSTVMKENEGISISTETTDGEVQDLIIEGNTFQDSTDLSIIKSSGELQENGTYKLSFLCRGRNLMSSSWELGGIDKLTGENTVNVTLYRTKDFIRVPNNSKIYINQDMNLYKYDINKKFIEYGYVNANRYFETGNDCAYIKFHRGSIPSDMMLVEDSNEPYEQYQEHVQDIYLPCDLSRVGNVADRLICKDGVWGVEVSNDTVLLNERTFSSNDATIVKGDYVLLPITYSNLGYADSLIEDGRCITTFGEALTSSQWATPSIEGIYIGKTAFGIVIHKDTIKGTTKDAVKNYFIGKEHYFKRNIANPHFLPLDNDQQVKLKTFMNHTNIVSLNEIPPTIKGKVPNSLKDTVSSNVKSIDRIDKQLQNTVSELVETTGYEYKSENNYINIKNSKEGTLDNVRVDGNTLVNLCGKSYDGSNGNYKIDFYYDLSEFTILCPIDDVLMNVRNSDGTWDGVLVQVKNGISYVKMDNGKKVRGFQIANTSPNLDKFKQGCIATLEGDYTENPPTYFEGLKSVGELEELEITSCNENLFDGEFEKGAFSNSDGTPIISPTYPNAHRSVNYVDVIPNTNYVYNKIDNGRTYFYKKDGTFLSSSINSQLPNMVFTTPNDCYKVKFNFENLISEVIISKGTTPKAYVPHKSDKKKLLYKDNDGTWKPVVLRKYNEDYKDYIEELADGRCKYHRRTFAFTIKSITGTVDRHTNNIYCYTSLLDNISQSDNYFPICDKLKGEDVYSNDREGISFYKGDANKLRFNLLKSKLAESTNEGVNNYLSENNFTIVGKLAQEEVYDCIDLSLNSFNGETSVFTNSSIPHKLSVTQKQGLKARVETLEQEMKFLYDNFNYALKQVLAGNTQELAYMLYPQDFTDYDNNDTDEDIPITIPNLK